MSRVRLLAREGKPVPEWSASPEELRRRVRLATREFAQFPDELKLRPLPRVPRRDLVVLPDRLPPAAYLRPWWFWCRVICPPRYRIRKNQRNLSATEWGRFIHAIEALAMSGVPTPTYQEFVEIHRRAMDTAAGHAWGAHGALNFLPWHREYLAKLEAALIAINPLVTIPYWDWVNDRAIPPQLNNAADIADWGITRGASFNAALLPTAPTVNAALASPDFATLTASIEWPHNTVHNVVSGTMGTSTSPADPLFWLHHAFIDKLWADWQVTHPAPGGNPTNMADTLQPPPIMTRTVAQVQTTRALGYVYA